MIPTRCTDGLRYIAYDAIDASYLQVITQPRKLHPNSAEYARRQDAMIAGMYKYGEIPPRYPVPAIRSCEYDDTYLRYEIVVRIDCDHMPGYWIGYDTWLSMVWAHGPASAIYCGDVVLQD